MRGGRGMGRCVYMRPGAGFARSGRGRSGGFIGRGRSMRLPYGAAVPYAYGPMPATPYYGAPAYTYPY